MEVVTTGKAQQLGAPWPGAEKFILIQDILDTNKMLINEINLNHATRTPECLARNVILIRELNNGLKKVMEQYQHLSDYLTHLEQDPITPQLRAVSEKAG